MKHTDTHYYFETTRKEGKRRVTDTHQVPWEEFNKTELMALAIRDHDGTTLGHKIWDRIHVGLRRQDLIRMVCGELPENLDTNPIHRLREAIHGGLRDNWRFINTQVRCSTNCAECPDAQPVSCYLINERSIIRPKDRDIL